MTVGELIYELSKFNKEEQVYILETDKHGDNAPYIHIKEVERCEDDDADFCVINIYPNPKTIEQ